MKRLILMLLLATNTALIEAAEWRLGALGGANFGSLDIKGVPDIENNGRTAGAIGAILSFRPSDSWSIEVRPGYTAGGAKVLVEGAQATFQAGNLDLPVPQEVFVSLIRHQERMTGAYPSSLLYRIATNLSLNRIRDRKRHADLPGDDVLGRIARLDNLDAPVLLDRLFGRQPESTRTMAVLRHVDGLTLEEVARECSMSVSGVRRRLRILRDNLQSLGGPRT